MSDLKKQLIKLGSTNPELRPHIREILASSAEDQKRLMRQTSPSAKLRKQMEHAKEMGLTKEDVLALVKRRPEVYTDLAIALGHMKAKNSSIKTAGAVDFFVFMKGTDAKRLFREAQEDAEDEARWEAEDEGEEYEGGYSGTIAEKPGFRIMGQAETFRDAQQMADRMIDKNDKWGPAFAIEVGKGGRTEGFYFFGWASS